MIQDALDFGPLARRSDPPSSHAAADQIEPDTARQRQLVLAAINAHPGRTAKELAGFVPGMDKVQIGRRLGELDRAGRIDRVKSGARELRCFAR